MSFGDVFCYSRKPGYFWGVKFLMDRFHISNHTTCSCLYDCDTYRDKGNSQGCEQINRKFQKIETSLLLMNFTHAIVFILCFMAFINILKTWEQN